MLGCLAKALRALRECSPWLAAALSLGRTNHTVTPPIHCEMHMPAIRTVSGQPVPGEQLRALSRMALGCMINYRRAVVCGHWPSAVALSISGGLPRAKAVVAQWPL